MSVEIDNLVESIQSLTAGVKTAIDSGKTDAVNGMNTLMDEMTDQYGESAEQFQDDGGPTVQVAIVERHLPLDLDAQIDLSEANHFSKTITNPTIFSVINPAEAGRVNTFILHLDNAGNRVTWWPGIVWTGGVKPTLSDVGHDVLAFTSINGGVTWSGFLVGKDMKQAA